MVCKYFIAYELEYDTVFEGDTFHGKELRNTSITTENEIQSFDEIREIEAGLVKSLNKIFVKDGSAKALRAIILNWKPF